MNIDDRIEEPASVKQCAEGEKTFYFKCICLVSKDFTCRYQGRKVLVLDDQIILGNQYYICNKYAPFNEAEKLPNAEGDLP